MANDKYFGHFTANDENSNWTTAYIQFTMTNEFDIILSISKSALLLSP